MAVYFFYGDEDYNIELELESMKSKLNQDFIAMNFQNLDNPEYTELITALRTPPMMFGDMLIVINADKYFLSQKNYFEDAELEDIEDALKNNEKIFLYFYTDECGYCQKFKPFFESFS